MRKSQPGPFEIKRGSTSACEVTLLLPTKGAFSGAHAVLPVARELVLTADSAPGGRWAATDTRMLFASLLAASQVIWYFLGEPETGVGRHHLV